MFTCRVGRYSSWEAAVHTNTEFRKKRGIKVSIFDRFVSTVTNGTNEQEKNAFPPTPYRRLLSELDTAGEDAREEYPDDTQTVNDFVARLKEVCKARRKKTSELVKAEAQFILSANRMRAYACLLPPENNGAELTLEEFLDDMHYEGITYGISQESLQQEFDRGYLRIFLAAQGTPPREGEDGKVTELFQRRGNQRLEVQDEMQVDFQQDIQLQPIRKGAVICLIRPARPGTDGMDVTGQTLPCPQTVSALVPQGTNTAIGRGGQALTASVDGLLYMEQDRLCIHEQNIIDGDLDQFQGLLQISGNLYIGGNVDGGAEIEASGDIVINGKLGQARVTSKGGTIRVQQGIYGSSEKTFLSAACQVQAPVMEWADIDAGGSVIAEMISNCTICCTGTVCAITGRGMIAGTRIQAGGSVLCQRIGNLAGDLSRFSVGYPPHCPETWNRLKAELAEVQSTLNKLWATISDLRKRGSRISDMEKSVLEQLVVQRDLYDERRESLTVELNVLDEMLSKKSNGRIQCENLHPVLEIQIGRLAEKITTMEENCNIRAVESRIFIK